MPRSMEDIIKEIIESHGIGADDDEQLKEMRTLMQDPSQMQDTMDSVMPYPIPNKDMMTNPQRYDTMNPPPPSPMPYLDRTGPMTKYDDNQTRQQQERTDTRRAEDYLIQRPEINPNASRMDEFGIDDVPPAGEAPPQSSMQRLYRQMPQQAPPPSQMPALPHVPRQNDQQMQQLMDFYTSGGQVEM